MSEDARRTAAQPSDGVNADKPEGYAQCIGIELPVLQTELLPDSSSGSPKARLNLGLPLRGGDALEGDVALDAGVPGLEDGRELGAALLDLLGVDVEG